MVFEIQWSIEILIFILISLFTNVIGMNIGRELALNSISMHFCAVWDYDNNDQRLSVAFFKLNAINLIIGKQSSKCVI